MSARRALTLAAAALALVAPGLARPQQLNVITAVELKDEGSSVVLSVKGSRPPNFTTFSMADPPRFVIDLSESRFEGVPEDLVVQDGVVNVVKNLSYGSDATSIARVMIAFQVDVEPPDVQTAGNTLVVRVVKPGAGAVAAAPPAEQAPAAAPAAAAPAQPDAAAEAAARAEAERLAAAQAAADAQARAEAQAAADAKVEEDRRNQADAEARAQAEAQAQAQAREAEEKSAAAAKQQADEEARQRYETEQRAAADQRAREEAAQTAAQRRADEEARQAAAAAPQERAPAQEPIAAAPPPPPPAVEPPTMPRSAERLDAGAPSARLREIGFKEMPGVSRVYVRTTVTPRFTIEDAGENTIRVELENTRATRRNDTRFMDTSFFPGAVALVSPKKRGSSYVVEIKLKQRVPFQQKIEGDMLAIDFERPAAPAPVPGADAAPEAAPADGEPAPAGEPPPASPQN